MTPQQRECILDLTFLIGDLTRSARKQDMNEFIQTLTSIERLANFTRGQMLKRTYIDPTDVNDEEL